MENSKLEIGKSYIRTYDNKSTKFFDLFKIFKVEGHRIYTHELYRVYDDRVLVFSNTSFNYMFSEIRPASQTDVDSIMEIVATFQKDNKYSLVTSPTSNTLMSMMTYTSTSTGNESTQFIKYTKEQPLPEKESILLQADKIVNGDRNEQYGDPNIAFEEYRTILKATFGIDLTSAQICKVLMAIKLGRMKYKYKEDSLVDLCGYTEILNRLEK
jgi:hypothetical protein